MFSNALFAGYLGVGAICSSLFIYFKDRDIKKLENDEPLDDSQEKELDTIAESNKYFGGKGTIVIIFFTFTFFWFPSLIWFLIKEMKGGQK